MLFGTIGCSLLVIPTKTCATPSNVTKKVAHGRSIVGRSRKPGKWELKSCVATHKCIPPDKADRSKGHRQLTSKYLGYKLLNEISHDPNVKVKFLMSLVSE